MTKNSERRNILIIHQHFCPPGGFGNNRSFEIAKHLSTLGHHVTILTGSGNYAEQPKKIFTRTHIEGLQIDCIRVPYNHHMSYTGRVWSFVLFFILSCSNAWKYKKNIDVIYAISTPLSVGVIGLWFQKIVNKPMFFEIGDLWPDVPVQMGILKNKLFVRFLYALEKRIYTKSKHIVLLAAGMKEYLLKKNIPAEKMTVLYNGTNIEQFIPASDKASLRKQYNIPTDAFVVLYAGTMGIANGLEFFVDTAAHLQQKENSRIQFYFIGNGNRLDALKFYVESKNIQNCSFIESLPKTHVVDYFKLADVGIVSFDAYKILETNSANKYYDYLASGLPVLINYEGWQKTVLEKNGCGFSVSTPAMAADTLLNLSTDAALYQRMSLQARLLAEKEYDRKTIATQLSKLILLHS